MNMGCFNPLKYMEHLHSRGQVPLFPQLSTRQADIIKHESSFHPCVTRKQQEENKRNVSKANFANLHHFQ